MSAEAGVKAANGVYLVSKTHVQHTIRFVEHHHIKIVQIQRAFLQVFEHPTRRAHDDMRTMLP